MVTARTAFTAGNPWSDSLASTYAKLAAPITPVRSCVRTSSAPGSSNSKASTAEASSTTGPPLTELLTGGIGPALGNQLVRNALGRRGIPPHEGLGMPDGIVHAFQHEAAFGLTGHQQPAALDMELLAQASW